MPAPTRTVVELWTAYEQAQAAARAEAEDVQLTSAATQWQEASEQALLTGSDQWSFVFYLPAENALLDVMVGGDGANVVNQTQVWDASEILTKGAWRTGPRDALLAFLAHDGRKFLDENSHAVVDLHLSVDEAGEPTWNIVALNPEGRSVLALRVDAETMQVSSLTP